MNKYLPPFARLTFHRYKLLSLRETIIHSLNQSIRFLNESLKKIVDLKEIVARPYSRIFENVKKQIYNGPQLGLIMANKLLWDLGR